MKYRMQILIDVDDTHSAISFRDFIAEQDNLWVSEANPAPNEVTIESFRLVPTLHRPRKTRQ